MYSKQYGILVGAEKGLFQLRGNKLIKFDTKIDTGHIWHIKFSNKLGILIGAENGLFQLRRGNLKKFDINVDTGRVWDIDISKQYSLVIGAVNGLFLFRRNKFTKYNTGVVYKIVTTKQHGLLAGTRNGLFQLRENKLIKLSDKIDTGEVSKIVLSKLHGILVGAEKGLYQLDEKKLIKFDTKVDTGMIFKIMSTKQHGFLVGANKGLFQLRGNKLIKLNAEVDLGWIYDVDSSKEYGLFVRTSQGIFQLHRNKLIQLIKGQLVGLMSKIKSSKKYGLIIGVLEGVYQLRRNRFVMLDSKVYRGWTNQILLDKKLGFLISAGKGVFKIRKDKLTKYDAKVDKGEISQMLSAKPSGFLVRATQGLFLLTNKSVTNNTIDFIHSGSYVSVFRNQPHPFRWKIKHECAFVLKSKQLDELFRVQPIKRVNSNLQVEERNGTFFLSAELDFSDADTHTQVRLETKDEGEWTQLGKAIEVRVNWRSADYIRHIVQITLPWFFIGHTILFVSLILNARWSSRCWKLVTDPIWGRLGLWFYFALRHSRWLQLWIFEHWFTTVKKRQGIIPYLSMPLTDEKSGNSVASLDLNHHITPHTALWIQGDAGMGKTALIEYLFNSYFLDEDSNSLRHAYRKFGFVPILVRLREFRLIVPDKNNPGHWGADLARAAIEESGLVFSDRSLFYSILTSIGAVVIFDGANEVVYAEELEFFAQQSTSIGVVITSQSLPRTTYKKFQVWQLPETITDAIKPLLELYLGSERGTEIDAEIDEALRKNILSGYDVRLLADLVEEKNDQVELPKERLGLYEAIFAILCGVDGNSYPLSRLAEETWKMWCQGIRKFSRDDLPLDLMSPLELGKTGAKVVRSFDGILFEFRHDQMRGYLAARWAALHVVSPITLFENLPEIWCLESTEQRIVWDFFAELVSPDVGKKVFKWATLKNERKVLVYAIAKLGKQND